MSTFSNFFNNKKSNSLTCSKNECASPFFDFQQEFDNIFKKFYQALPMSVKDFNNLNISPAMDIVEDEKSFKVEMEMPGVDEKDIKVSIDNGVLTIKASKEISRKDEKKDYVMREINYGSYERSISLPDNTDIDNAESTFKKGMLWINIPKKATDKSKVKELEIKKVID